MNKKALALIIGGLILIALIIYFIFIYDFRKTETPEGGTGTTEIAEPVISKPSPTQQSGEPLSAAEQSRENANQLAISFAERYGTASSQANFSNLVESKLFMTDAFKARTDTMIAAERAKVNAAPAYQSIVTKAAIAEFVTFNEVAGTAEGTVKTKRQETTAEGTVSSYESDLKITLKKQNNEWKVDSAVWSK